MEETKDLVLLGPDTNNPSYPLDILERIKDMLKHGNIHALPTSIKETNHFSDLCVNEGARNSRIGKGCHISGGSNCMPKHWERCLPTMKVKSFSNFYLAQSAVQALPWILSTIQIWTVYRAVQGFWTLTCRNLGQKRVGYWWISMNLWVKVIFGCDGSHVPCFSLLCLG